MDETGYPDRMSLWDLIMILNCIPAPKIQCAGCLFGKSTTAFLNQRRTETRISPCEGVSAAPFFFPAKT